MEKIRDIIRALNMPLELSSVSQFRAEEDGAPYRVWKLETNEGSFVLKKTTPLERDVYRTFFPRGGPVPQVYAFGSFEGEWYMLMEYVPGESLSHCTRRGLELTLEAMIESQKRYWNDESHACVGYGFADCYPNRCKRLQYMGDLTKSYQTYLDCFAAVPRTLCNDDMLPFNVLVTDHRAVILDWEYGGILPYPCALARLIAFGEEDAQAMFHMSEEDRQFALNFYYEKLIRGKGISRAEYDRTMKLFLLKEYSEWVYCAGLSGDYEMDYYQKYYEKAKVLAEELGLYEADSSPK